MNIGTTEIFLILSVLMVLVVPLAVLILLVVYLPKNRQKNHKKCPFCAETIQKEAVVCRFCGRDLP